MTVDVRGRGNTWKVSYPSEANLKSPVPVYDRDGVYKETIYCAGGEMSKNSHTTESVFTGSREEAVQYAEYLLPGCEVSVTRTLTKQESLERARKARRSID